MCPSEAFPFQKAVSSESLDFRHQCWQCTDNCLESLLEINLHSIEYSPCQTYVVLTLQLDYLQQPTYKWRLFSMN